MFVDRNANFVSGDVGSVKATCVGGRRVNVFRNGVQYGFTSITEPDGTWTNGAGDIQPGDDIRVVVPTRYLRRSSSHQHVCKKVVVHFT